MRPRPRASFFLPEGLKINVPGEIIYLQSRLYFFNIKATSPINLLKQGKEEFVWLKTVKLRRTQEVRHEDEQH